MSEKPEPNRQFEPVPLSQVIKLLQEGVSTLASTAIWTKNQEIAFNARLALVSELDPIFYIWEPQDLDLLKFANAIKASGEVICRFSMSLETANVFFKADFLGRDPGGLKFRIPTAVYKVQRRKDLRMTIPPGYTLKVRYTDPENPQETCEKKILDISAGGIAFTVKPEEESFYRAGVILSRVTLTVRNTKIVCNAEIRHSRGLKVGLLFQGITNDEAALITDYVNEETKKYFSRYM